ncbi:hypothetical protein C8R46DRAFT_28026 [Mycena filopes]|nr:hypothetical protein C8R46DRAFT_28026 [Mycena filopes]
MGREKLLNTQLQEGYACGWYRFWTPNEQCAFTRQCTKTRESRLRDYLNSTRIQPPMLALSRFVPTSDKNKKFCAACRQIIGDSSTAGRRKIWEELPTFFELPAWNELKNDM